MSICTSTFVLEYTDTTNASSNVWEVDYYPTDTISGENVFMTMKNAVVNVANLPTPITTQIPFQIEILNLPQACGTITVKDEDCKKSNHLGFVVTNQTTVESPRILTYIPDGHQVLQFKITQVGSGTSLQQGMVFVITLQLEVSNKYLVS